MTSDIVPIRHYRMLLGCSRNGSHRLRQVQSQPRLRQPCCRLMGAVAEAVGSGLGSEHVIGVIPAALAPREVQAQPPAPWHAAGHEHVAS